MTDTINLLQRFVDGVTRSEAAVSTTELNKLIDAGLIRRPSGSAGAVYTGSRGRPAFVYVLTKKGRRALGL